MLVSIIDSMNSEQLKGYAENVSFFLSLQKKKGIEVKCSLLINSKIVWQFI